MSKRVGVLWVLVLMLVCGFHANAVASSEISEIRKLAERGDPAAQNNLGYHYLKGEGVAKDVAKALKWFRKAAEKGDADAQFNLGLAYGKGEGVKKDVAEAMKWIGKAAEQGHANAKEVLKKLQQAGAH